MTLDKFEEIVLKARNINSYAKDSSTLDSVFGIVLSISEYKRLRKDISFYKYLEPQFPVRDELYPFFEKIALIDGLPIYVQHSEADEFLKPSISRFINEGQLKNIRNQISVFRSVYNRIQSK